tara:strand:- start:347 stop:535 length:189 start_codon:yes stop_codon:yes gene_type:complete
VAIELLRTPQSLQLNQTLNNPLLAFAMTKLARFAIERSAKLPGAEELNGSLISIMTNRLQTK